MITRNLEHLFKEPFKTPVYDSCYEDWYLYGKGPHSFSTRPGPSEGKDVNVFSSYGDNYDNRDKNFSDGSRLIVEHNSKRIESGFRDEYARAFLKFRLPNIHPDSVKFGFSRLTLRGGFEFNTDLEEDDFFMINPVSSSWGENEITWNNQPEILPNPKRKVNVFSSSYSYYLVNYIDSLVSTMINQGNHGMRLSLEGATRYEDKGVSISSSEASYSGYRPRLKMRYETPFAEKNNPVTKIFNVTKGDTVMISYEIDGVNPAFRGLTSNGTEIVNGDTLRGHSFTLHNLENNASCESSYSVVTEEIEGLLVIRDETKPEDDILLGQSKYYAAIENPEDNTSILIKEIEAINGIPSSPVNIVLGAFKGNPIELISGGKSGVYWERNWAIIDENGNINKGELPSGMIRVVGRYWEDGKEYKVKLKTTGNGRNGELEIKVVKPDRLGAKYGKARDVFDQVVNVDSLIIANAGKYGIPPQVIKAHISGEVYTKDFGGEIGEGFTPGYLYEPFTVEFWLRDKNNNYKLLKEWENNIFKVSKESMGTGGAVPKHEHTEKQVYPTTPKTIWDLVSEYSSIEHSSPPGEFNSYAKRKNNNTNELVFYDFYTEPKEIYNAIITDVKKKNKKLEEEEVFKKANDSLTVYLKTSWRGGLDSLYAQTRIAASYGYFQVLYTTGILPISSYGANYPKTKIPEKINETETNFQLAMKKYRYLLKEKSVSKWDAGYEKVWFDLLSNWNSKTTYNAIIFEKIENYLPFAK